MRSSPTKTWQTKENDHQKLGVELTLCVSAKIGIEARKTSNTKWETKRERERDRWEVYQQQLECRNVRDRCWYPTSTRHGCVVSLRGAPYNRDVSWVAVKTAEMWHQDAPPRLAENFESPNQHCTPELLVNNSTWVARARIMSENSQGANNFFWSLGL